MKNCKVCGAEFYPENPLVKICSDDCRKESHKKAKDKWRTDSDINKKRWCEYTNEYRKRNPLKAKLSGIQSKCKRLGLPFNLKEEDLNPPEVCPVLGIPLDSSTRDRQWSLDRLIPEKGYMKENIRIISMKANRLKNDATIEELEKILFYMKNNA